MTISCLLYANVILMLVFIWLVWSWTCVDIPVVSLNPVCTYAWCGISTGDKQGRDTDAVLGVSDHKFTWIIRPTMYKSQTPEHITCHGSEESLHALDTSGNTYDFGCIGKACHIGKWTFEPIESHDMCLERLLPIQKGERNGQLRLEMYDFLLYKPDLPKHTLVGRTLVYYTVEL
jgi:hypothetical protein